MASDPAFWHLESHFGRLTESNLNYESQLCWAELPRLLNEVKYSNQNAEAESWDTSTRYEVVKIPSRCAGSVRDVCRSERGLEAPGALRGASAAFRGPAS